MFEILPAIDVSEGRLCRMGIGGPAPVKEFEGDPLAAATAYAASGVRWIHVVDIDLAFTGRPENLGLITAIHTRFPDISIEASGGFALREDIERSISAGASRAVLGSSALADRDSVEALLHEYGDALVVGIETEGRAIRPRGKDRSVELDVASTLDWLKGVPVSRFLHTNVRRVGQLRGPDLDGLAVVLGTGRPVVAAGGIASMEDIRAVYQAGAEGSVIGRAALEGGVDIAEAVRELNREEATGR